MIGLTVGMLTTMWKNVDPNTVVEVSVAGLTGLVVRSASAQDDVAHLDVGTVSQAEIRLALEEATDAG